MHGDHPTPEQIQRTPVRPAIITLEEVEEVRCECGKLLFKVDWSKRAIEIRCHHSRCKQTTRIQMI